MPNSAPILPLYRLQDYFAGCGWAPSRSTQLNILSAAAFVVEPLLDFFKKTLLSDRGVGCDDTSLTLLYPKTLPQLDLSHCCLSGSAFGDGFGPTASGEAGRQVGWF